VVGGRGGLRVLLDLLGDRDPQIRRGAVQSLGTLGDAAAVPFLARLLNDDDEELQVAAVGALGRIGSAEAVPALLGVLNRRAGLFGGKKLQRVKSAALAALARIPTAGAREVLASTAAGKDSDLASEARRILATLE
jgi:HEAT repeat protein